ncbi:hypothetical protein QMO56_24935 [Roseomonas sp. E05]|uniref:hypothetical protein n=1 Tax=Roseomonas sp. E05 TaxID=3046310 RepID=UPI0024BBA93A|nr:hypothetical protein [Roseomonas sp. E05]MDJ0391357.1 hypothetical protein [Roseomonas sp. E05]
MLYRPSFLRRCLAYLANGDLPPLSGFRPPAQLPWYGGPVPGAPPLPGGFPPKIPASSFAAAYVGAVALGSFGLGLMLAGAAL